MRHVPGWSIVWPGPGTMYLSQDVYVSGEAGTGHCPSHLLSQPFTYNIKSLTLSREMPRSWEQCHVKSPQLCNVCLDCAVMLTKNLSVQMMEMR